MQHEWIKGVKASIPIVLGYVPIGLAFGILASQQGLSVGEIFSMSLIVYAGSAQFIAAAMMSAGAGAFSVISTAFLVNLRHLLMSAALSPHMKKFSRRQKAFIAFGITDETFAVTSSYAGDNKTSPEYFMGIHIVSQMSWIAATVLGGIFGGRISDSSKWGIDFALSAMFIGLLVMQLKNRIYILVAVFAGVLSLILALTLKGNWNVIIAAVIAATAGVITERWTGKQSLSS